MGKSRSMFFCQECGYGTPKWLGKCPGCGSWNTLVEENVKESPSLSGPGRPAEQLAGLDMEETFRFSTGVSEFDRVLGGGIIPGSLVLIGGDPGIGKSTLLLQVAENLSRRGKKVLYLSGEESPRQIKLRSQRLGVEGENVYIVNEPDIGLLGGYLDKIQPALVIIDSIQTVFSTGVGSVPGSVSQLRECTGRLMEMAKRTERPFFLVGHVTKEGVLAGPKVLEHMVDTVIYFEGDRDHYYRILRAIKNRFGSVNEVGILEMTGMGLVEVDNPSLLFLGRGGGVSGVSVVASFEGTRAILVEVEALVLGPSYGYPRRMATGVDANRLALIAAVLEKRAGLALGNRDIYLKASGGAVLKDPATDLGVAMAVASSLLEKEVPPGAIIMGELGLSGEIRPVPFLDGRLREADRMGFKEALVPPERGQDNLSHLQLRLCRVATIKEALDHLK